MSEIENIKKMLADGLEMMDNIENPIMEEHRTMIYVDSANAKLRKVGELIHRSTPDLSDMIDFVHEHVPGQYHGVMNHVWSGIGEWQA